MYSIRAWYLPKETIFTEGKTYALLSVTFLELDGPYPPYGYADLPLDTLPLEPDLHESYIPDMTYDARQTFPEPL